MDNIDKPFEVDDDLLKRKPIRKMIVDSKGIHCFFLADHELFYNHFSNDKVFQVTTNTQPSYIKSLDICYVSQGDYDVFEVLLGNDRGQIFHGCLQYTPKGLQPFDQFTLVLEVSPPSPILDIKIGKIGSKSVIIAASESKLFQFVRDGSLKGIFSEYSSNPQLLKEHTINIDISGGHHEEGEIHDEISVHLMYNPQNKQLQGFCWATEYGLGIG